MVQVRDAIERCAWPGIADPVYAHYHDTEWGVPHADERRLFEKLILEGFQAGLSWLTILKKREAFRAAFCQFEADRIARFDSGDVARLMGDAGIVRNRAKIEAAVTSARAYLALRETTTLGALLWGYFPDGPVHNRHRHHGDIAAATPVSTAISKDLKARGFRFVGPTTMYAFVQSSGMVNDHLVRCHRHQVCARLQAAFVRPAIGAIGSVTA
jgi:DNA-3-methyladenine glycosylase I